MTTKIAHITDIHLEETFPKENGVNAKKNWLKILQDISTKGINEIIFGGDIGEKTANKWFFESLRDYKIAITLGNHDSYKEATKHYNFEFIKTRSALYYSQLKDNHKFIFLDTSTESISNEQLDWLKKELITPKKIVLFLHHPILAIDAQVHKGYALKDRHKIKDELLNIKNEVTIFCGHYHLEDEKKEYNIRQYITPAASYQVEKLPNEIKVNNHTFGYRIIEFNEEVINTRVVLFS